MGARGVLASVVGLLLAVGLIGYAALGSFDGAGCTAAEQALIPLLRDDPLLVTVPPGSKPLRDDSGCFEDDPFPYAGRSFAYSGPRALLLAYYDAQARTGGWRPAEAYGPRCYTKRIDGATVFLSVDVVETDGYLVRLSGFYDWLPEPGWVVC